MIERYSRPEMSAIWSQENRYLSWLEVEIVVCVAWNQQGVIPDQDLQNILDKAVVDSERIRILEAETKHDVIAFLTSLEEKSGHQPDISILVVPLQTF